MSTPSRIPSQLPSGIQSTSEVAPNSTSEVPVPTKSPSTAKAPSAVPAAAGASSVAASRIGKSVLPSQRLVSRVPTISASRTPSAAGPVGESSATIIDPSIAGGKSVYTSIVHGARRPGQQMSAVPAGFGADALITQSQHHQQQRPVLPSASPSKGPSTIMVSHPSRLPPSPSQVAGVDASVPPVASNLPTKLLTKLPTIVSATVANDTNTASQVPVSQIPIITPKPPGTILPSIPSILGVSKAPASPARPSLIPSIIGVSKVPGSSQVPGASAIGRSVIPAPGGRILETTYTTPADLKRAERQLKYNSLTWEQKVVQDAWANRKGLEMAPCPNNFGWERHAQCPGYQCSGGMHYIPDVLIAEGVPGLYTQMPPPWSSSQELTPHWSQRIPSGFFGPVRPIGQDPDTKRWKFPPWSYQ